MSDVKVCRICLCKDVKLYNYNRYNLRQYYEQVMYKKVNDQDGLSHNFCYVCAAMLYKFYKFKKKCHTGEMALKELLRSKRRSLTSITHKDRQDLNLTSSIDHLSVSKRIKTYIIKHKSVAKYVKNVYNKVKIAKVLTIEELKVEDDSDNSLDKNVSDTKCDMVDIETEKNQNDEIKNEITKADIENGVHKESLSDLEDDRVISGDEDFNSENVNDVDEIIVVKEDEEVSDKTKVTQEKISHDNKEEKYDDDKNINEKPKAKKLNNAKVDTYLDPKHWLKIKLSEEEAAEEFKSKAQCPKYLKAAFKCTDCFKGFSKEDMLKRHNKLGHVESVGPVVCRFCNMRFKWKCYLTCHMEQHYTRYKCLRCDITCPLKTSALFHNEYHNGVVRKCVHCGEEFRHISTYYTHLRTHRSEHVCTLCGASFVSVTGLGLHKKVKHRNADSELPQGEEQYCQRCDVKFETRKAYEEHLIHSAMHVDGIEDLEKNGPTSSNPKKRRRQYLKRMTRIPTDCRVCGKHFSTQTACKKHHLAEHPRTSFLPPNERHICEICGMSLAPSSVWSHLNTHTRDKSYTCNTCGRQFSSKLGLNKHQLSHSSEKPVACTLCDKRFKEKSSMKLHYRTFHLKEPYPKRNRKKKTDELTKDEDSDDNMTLDNLFARKYSMHVTS